MLVSINMVRALLARLRRQRTAVSRSLSGSRSSVMAASCSSRTNSWTCNACSSGKGTPAITNLHSPSLKHSLMREVLSCLRVPGRTSRTSGMRRNEVDARDRRRPRRIASRPGPGAELQTTISDKISYRIECAADAGRGPAPPGMPTSPSLTSRKPFACDIRRQSDGEGRRARCSESTAA